MIASTILLTVAGASAAIGMVVQWRDCIPGYGNTMGIGSMVMTFWMLTAVTGGIGVALLTAWWWGLLAGVTVMFAQRAVVGLIDRVGTAHKRPKSSP